MASSFLHDYYYESMLYDIYDMDLKDSINKHVNVRNLKDDVHIGKLPKKHEIDSNWETLRSLHIKEV